MVIKLRRQFPNENGHCGVHCESEETIQGSLTKRIVQLFWTIFKQLLTPSPFALNIHVAIFWPCFSGRLLLLCTYFTRPLKFYGNVFSIVLFFVLVLIPANILYVWAGICLWCFQDFHMKRKGRRLWNPDYFLSCRNYLVKRLRKEKEKQQETGEVFFKWRWWQRSRFFILFVFCEDSLPSYNSDGVF